MAIVFVSSALYKDRSQIAQDRGFDEVVENVVVWRVNCNNSKLVKLLNWWFKIIKKFSSYLFPKVR